MLHSIAWLGILLSMVIGMEVIAFPEKGIKLPKDGQTYDFDFIYNYIKYLHGIHRFNSFVTFSRPNVRFRPSFLVVRTLEQALLEDFKVPIIVWGMERTAKFRNNIGLNNLIFVQIRNITDPILDVVDYTLEGLRFISMLFFYKDKNNRPPTDEEIRLFFTWCWSRNMVNVALTFQLISRRNQRNIKIIDIRDRVYNYSPFPILTVFNLTDEINNGGGSFTVDRIKRVNGYAFKTLLLYHPPFVFRAPNKENCQMSLKCPIIIGTIGRLYTEYIKYIGGTIEIVEFTNLNFSTMREKILLAAARKEVHIGVHPFSDILLSSEMSEGSYPVGQVNICIIVPFRREMAREHYFIRSFQPSIWILVLVTFAALFGVQFFFGYGFTLSNRNSVAFSGYALISTATVMLDQVCSIGFFRSYWPWYKLLHLIIIVMAFVLSNTYTASLTSLLTTAPFDVQINSVQEFLDSGLKILLTKTEKQLFFDADYLPKKLVSRIHLTDRVTVDQHLNNMSTKYAYLLTSEQWKMLAYRQKHLDKPLFHMPSKELCTAQFFHKLPLQWDSPFSNSLALFFMLTQESGFSSKWEEMSNYELRQMQHLKPLENDVKRWQPLDLKHFLLAAYLIFSLWILAVLCFLGEIFWYHCARLRSTIRKVSFEILPSKRALTKRVGQFYKQPKLPEMAH